MLTQEQLARAPKFARQEIERLQMRLDEAEKKIAMLSAATGAESIAPHLSGAYLNKVVVDTLRAGLIFPDSTDAEFGMGKGFINCRIGNGKLYVYGSDTLRIQPQSSNVIHVWVER